MGPSRVKNDERKRAYKHMQQELGNRVESAENGARLFQGRLAKWPLEVFCKSLKRNQNLASTNAMVSLIRNLKAPFAPLENRRRSQARMPQVMDNLLPALGFYATGLQEPHILAQGRDGGIQSRIAWQINRRLPERS